MSNRHHISEQAHQETAPQIAAEAPAADLESLRMAQPLPDVQRPAGGLSRRPSWFRSTPWWVLPLAMLDLLAVAAGCTVTLEGLVPVGWYPLCAAAPCVLMIVSLVLVLHPDNIRWPG